MGTRGLVFIRCNGRYYVYYNHYDSYAEGLGEAIVAEIPADAEQYEGKVKNRLLLDKANGSSQRGWTK